MNSVYFILLIGFVFCQSAERDCDWYNEDITLKELQNKGYQYCGIYTCDKDEGYLNFTTGCPPSMTGPCAGFVMPEEIFDVDKPFPGCCSTYKCKE